MADDDVHSPDDVLENKVENMIAEKVNKVKLSYPGICSVAATIGL